MAIVVEQIVHRTHVTVDDGDATTVTLTGVASGSTLILTVAVFYEGTFTALDVTDDKSNSWVLANQFNGDAGSYVHIYKAENANAGDTIISMVPTSSAGATATHEVEADAWELSGLPTSGTQDKSIDNSGSSNDASTAWGTLAQADEILIQMASHTAGDTSWTEDTTDSYTLVSKNESNTGQQTYITQYKIVSTTTGGTANAALGASRTWFTCGASFIADGGAPSNFPVVAAKTSAGIVSAVLSLTKPADVAVGETLIIFVGSDDDTDTANWDNVTNKPAGFTLIRTAGSATVDAHIAAFWKIADGTESAVASIPKGGGSDDYWGAYLRITGAHATTPIHNIGSTTFAAATVSATFAPVTTSTGSCLLLFGVSYDGSDATYSVNAANGWSQLMTVIVGSASAGGGCGMVASRQAAGASANAGPAVSFGLSDGVVAFTIAIAPSSDAVVSFNPYPVIWQNYRNMGIM